MEPMNMDSLESYFKDLGIVTSVKRLKRDEKDELEIGLQEQPPFRLSLLPLLGGMQMKWTVLPVVSALDEDEALTCCNDWNSRCEPARFYVTRENVLEAVCVQPPFCEKPLQSLLITASMLSKFVGMVQREWAKTHAADDDAEPETVET